MLLSRLAVVAQYAAALAARVNKLQARVEDLRGHLHAVDAAVSRLQSCDYSAKAFRRELETIQDAVDALNLAGFTNLKTWVPALDVRIDTILLARMREAGLAWVAAFEASGDANNDDGGDDTTSAQHHRHAAHANVQRMVHQVTLRNRRLHLEPPLERSREAWVAQLHKLLRVACGLSPLTAGRYDQVLQGAAASAGGASARGGLASSASAGAAAAGAGVGGGSGS